MPGFLKAIKSRIQRTIVMGWLLYYLHTHGYKAGLDEAKEYIEETFD